MEGPSKGASSNCLLPGSIPVMVPVTSAVRSSLLAGLSFSATCSMSSLLVSSTLLSWYWITNWAPLFRMSSSRSAILFTARGWRFMTALDSCSSLASVGRGEQRLNAVDGLFGVAETVWIALGNGQFQLKAKGAQSYSGDDGLAQGFPGDPPCGFEFAGGSRGVQPDGVADHGYGLCCEVDVDAIVRLDGFAGEGDFHRFGSWRRSNPFQFLPGTF